MKYSICNNCVMDNTAIDIVFNEKGVCNYCKEFHERFDKNQNRTITIIENQRKELIKKIKEKGKNKPYDCVFGISGGVDSSWGLVQARKLGLRPLVVHMDNGWNSELSQNNIANLVTGLGLDLYTHVIEWNEYKALMNAFFSADVIDVELLYDNAMFAVNYNQARKYGIQYILSGNNFSTEGMRMPPSWNWYKFDKRNIKDIANKFGVKNLNTFPYIGTIKLAINNVIFKCKWIPFLDFFDYKKSNATDELVKEFSYKPYPYKHYENVFTRFYQGYILPNKFNVDKRKLHFSSLILSNQMTRVEAIKVLKKMPYESEVLLNEDKEYFIKKMDWSFNDLNLYLQREAKNHNYYKSEINLYKKLKKLRNFIKL